MTESPRSEHDHRDERERQFTLQELSDSLHRIFDNSAGSDADTLCQAVILLLKALAWHPLAELESVYRSFQARIKELGDTFEYIRLLPLYVRLIGVFEGRDALRMWLKGLTKTTPPPLVGFVHMQLAYIGLKDDPMEAVCEHALAAVQNGMRGVNWYLVSALEVMSLCQARVGNHRLSFEYARMSAILRYARGEVSDHNLLRACYGMAALYGQVDYRIDFHTQLAQEFRDAGNHARAAVEEANAATALGSIGAHDLAASRLHDASKDACQAGRGSDRAFALSCRLLARLHRERQIDEAILRATCSDLLNTVKDGLIHCLVSEVVNDGIRLQVLSSPTWKTSLNGLETKLNQTRGQEHEELLAFFYWLAILGRFAENLSKFEEALVCYDSPIRAAGREAVSTVALLVTEFQATVLGRLGRHSEAVQVIKAALETEAVCNNTPERFTFGRLLAEEELHLGDCNSAFTHAVQALGWWRRVMSGLFKEPHKLTWLKAAASCLSCAMRAISQPVDWLDERKRLLCLFSLTEFDKARVFSDFAAYRGYLLGAYLPDLMDVSLFDRWVTSQGEEERFWVPLIFFFSGLCHSDAVISVTHSHPDGGEWSDNVVDLRPIHLALRMPETAEQRLITSAEPCGFEGDDLPLDPSFFDDVFCAATRTSECSTDNGD